MRLTISLEEDLNTEDDLFSLKAKKEYTGKETSTSIRTEDLDGTDVTVYLSYSVAYNDDLPTWIDNINECVKAIEKYYGYPFDMKKYSKHLKEKEKQKEEIEKRSRTSEFFSEDPDH